MISFGGDTCVVLLKGLNKRAAIYKGNVCICTTGGHTFQQWDIQSCKNESDPKIVQEVKNYFENSSEKFNSDLVKSDSIYNPYFYPSYEHVIKTTCLNKLFILYKKDALPKDILFTILNFVQNLFLSAKDFHQQISELKEQKANKMLGSQSNAFHKQIIFNK
jgi:hypothetical protein